MKDIGRFLFRHPYFTGSAITGAVTALDFAIRNAPTNEIALQYTLPIGLAAFGAMYAIEKTAAAIVRRLFPRAFYGLSSGVVLTKGQLEALKKQTQGERSWTQADLELYLSSKAAKAKKAEWDDPKKLEEWQRSIGMPGSKKDKK